MEIIECPRDAMQGWSKPIATETKVAYLTQLLRVGFDILDCGSFVSPKAIPQMADTAQVLEHISHFDTPTRLLVIVANEKGASQAVQFSKVTYLGFPFSISPTFQLNNTNSTLSESLRRVEAITRLCQQHQKTPLVYMSMGFGNPYGDPYSIDILLQWIQEMVALGVKDISLADTVGLATAQQITEVYSLVNAAFPGIHLGLHLHAAPQQREEKIAAALLAGCSRLDGAIRGFGGCPLSGNDLVGNIQTEWLLQYLTKGGYRLHINEVALQQAVQMAGEVFK